MHGFLTGNMEVKVGCVFHLISVSCFLYPVSNRVTVHTIHNVPGIINTASVMAGAAPWWQKRQPLEVSKQRPVNYRKNTFRHTNTISSQWDFVGVALPPPCGALIELQYP